MKRPTPGVAVVLARPDSAQERAGNRMKVTLLTGDEPHYQAGLLSGLAEQGLKIDVIGGDSLVNAAVLRRPGINFRNLRGKFESKQPAWSKLLQVVWYYVRLAGYAARTPSTLFHIQWPYKFVFLDRTLLNVYFKVMGKKLVFTAHNVDQDVRDGTHSRGNRASLRFMYWMMDHIIVHTNQMKTDLSRSFRIKESKISVIPHGINVAVPETALDRAGARAKLGLKSEQRVLLFFGLVAQYKGMEDLIAALGGLRAKGAKFTLLVAGKLKESQDYWERILRLIESEGLREQLVIELAHIPDESIEMYFKAADALVMPYRSIFQSGVLFLAYRFGLPVIATNVGSLGEDIIEGKTGCLARAGDPADLARTITKYFDSELFKDLATRREEVKRYADERYSWSRIGESTTKVYEQVLGA